jgi:class 3 adenylate cyclase
VLPTVLFTDLVGSTRHAATLGDRAWRQVLDRQSSRRGRRSRAFAAEL